MHAFGKTCLSSEKIDEALALRKEKKVTGDTVTILAVTKNHPLRWLRRPLTQGLRKLGKPGPGGDA